MVGGPVCFAQRSARGAQPAAPCTETTPAHPDCSPVVHQLRGRIWICFANERNSSALIGRVSSAIQFVVLLLKGNATKAEIDPSLLILGCKRHRCPAPRLLPISCREIWANLCRPVQMVPSALAQQSSTLCS